LVKNGDTLIFKIIFYILFKSVFYQFFHVKLLFLSAFNELEIFGFKMIRFSMPNDTFMIRQMIRFKKQKNIDYNSIFFTNDTFTRFFSPILPKFLKKKNIYILFFFSKN